MKPLCYQFIFSPRIAWITVWPGNPPLDPIGPFYWRLGGRPQPSPLIIHPELLEVWVSFSPKNYLIMCQFLEPLSTCSSLFGLPNQPSLESCKNRDFSWLQSVRALCGENHHQCYSSCSGHQWWCDWHGCLILWAGGCECLITCIRNIRE